MTYNSENTKSSLGVMTNPVIRKLGKVREEVPSGERAASYGGVISKTAFFLLLTAVGIAAYFIFHAYLEATGGLTINFESNKGVIFVQTATIEIIVLTACGVVALITALLSSFVRSIIPVTGTIYVLAEGYLLAFISNSLATNYRYLAFMALVITICLVLVMLTIFRAGVRVPSRFRRVIGIAFGTIILSSIVLFILNLIPGLSGAMSVINQVMTNPVVAVVFGIFFIFVACLFLLSDFESVRDIVEGGLPKKYEWTCAFGIAYTVLYLYLKILELLIRLVGNSKK